MKKYFCKQRGIAQIVVLVIMAVLAISLPVATNLVQKSQENRSQAAGGWGDLGEPCDCFSKISCDGKQPIECVVKIGTGCRWVENGSMCLESCSSGKCTEKVCEFGNPQSSKCSSGEYCSGAVGTSKWRCVSKKENGSSCNQKYECKSGNCSGNKCISNAVDGVCGSLNGDRGLTSAPSSSSSGLCSKGSLNDGGINWSSSGYWFWSCKGSSGGSDSSLCKAYKKDTTPCSSLDKDAFCYAADSCDAKDFFGDAAVLVGKVGGCSGVCCKPKCQRGTLNCICNLGDCGSGLKCSNNKCIKSSDDKKDPSPSKSTGGVGEQCNGSVKGECVTIGKNGNDTNKEGAACTIPGSKISGKLVFDKCDGGTSNRCCKVSSTCSDDGSKVCVDASKIKTCVKDSSSGVLGYVTSNCPSGQTCSGNNCSVPAPVTPACVEANWTSTLSPAVCPSNGQQTKVWSKNGNCSGGVSHSNETVGCTPSCSEDSWTFALSTCLSNGYQTKNWSKKGGVNCSGGVNHPASEIVSCTPNCVISCSGKCGGNNGCGGVCPNGCNLNQSCVGNVCVSKVGGVCGTTNNSCTAGSLSDTADTSTEYKWNCNGSNGGSNAGCTLAKAVPKLSFRISFGGLVPNVSCLDKFKKVDVVVGRVGESVKQSLVVDVGVISGSKNKEGLQVFGADNIALNMDLFGSGNVYVKIKGSLHGKMFYCRKGQTGKYLGQVCDISLDGSVNDFTEYSIIAGDVNRDGVINTVDFSLVKNQSGLLKEECNQVGDLNGDGKVNNFDLRLIKNALSYKDDE